MSAILKTTALFLLVLCLPLASKEKNPLLIENQFEIKSNSEVLSNDISSIGIPHPRLLECRSGFIRRAVRNSSGSVSVFCVDPKSKEINLAVDKRKQRVVKGRITGEYKMRMRKGGKYLLSKRVRSYIYTNKRTPDEKFALIKVNLNEKGTTFLRYSAVSDKITYTQENLKDTILNGSNDQRLISLLRTGKLISRTKETKSNAVRDSNEAITKDKEILKNSNRREQKSEI